MDPNRRLLRGLAAVATALSLVGCTREPPIQDDPYPTRVTQGPNIVGQSEVSVTQIDNAFEPSSIKIDDTRYVRVTVTNEGSNPHTFTLPELDIDAGRMQPGDTKTLTFPAPARKTRFICTIHEALGMTGELVPE